MQTIRSRRYRTYWLCLHSLVCAVTPAIAQVSEQPVPAPRSGFQFREASIYSSYYSLGLPPSLINSGAAPGQIGYDIVTGASASLAYTRSGERTTFNFVDTPSFTGRIRYSDWSALSNALHMQLDHSLTGRLRFNLSGAGAIRNREEFQFGQIAIPATPAGTAGSPPPDPSSPVGPSLGDTASQSLFFGSRIFTANVHTGLQYSISPRLSLTGGVGATRMQYLRNQRDDVQSVGLLPQVSALLGDFGLSYDLTPRTSIGVTFDSARQQSRLQDVVIMNGRFSVERALTQHWFVNAYGGAGQFRSVQSTIAAAQQVQQIFGGGATYRTYAHTIIGSFDRRVADIYGVGASNTKSLLGSWRWAPPRSRTWMAIGASRIQMDSGILPITTLRGTAELGRRLAGNLAIVGSYAYLGYSNLFIQSNGTLSQSAIRIAFTWNPGLSSDDPLIC